MPKEMSRLGSLQTLSNFVVSKKSGSTVKRVGGDFVSSWNTSNFEVAKRGLCKRCSWGRLGREDQLDEILLEWSGDTFNLENDRDVLEQLMPHTNLKKLSISFYYGSRFPSWLGDFSFSNMVFLRLRRCKNCLYLPPLGQLPALKELIIEQMDAVKRVGPEFCRMDKPFQSLETLTFEGMLE